MARFANTFLPLPVRLPLRLLRWLLLAEDRTDRRIWGVVVDVVGVEITGMESSSSSSSRVLGRRERMPFLFFLEVVVDVSVVRGGGWDGLGSWPLGVFVLVLPLLGVDGGGRSLEGEWIFA